MIIPFKVGKNSNAEDQFIDLSDVPLLMISYCEEGNLNMVLQEINQIEYPYKQANYFITNSKRISLKEDFNFETIYFLKDEPERGYISSRKSMFRIITDEITFRQQLLKAKKVKDFKRYFSLNLWNTEKRSYQFLIIDDIWDIVTAKPKDQVISLIRIILYGPAVGIHTIFASGISYRNLLEQLINVNPQITDLLQEKYGVPEPTQMSALGKELIYTPDGLIYYKSKNMGEIEKFYP
ncbi:MAG: hypothetical protein WCK67_08470 [bacterium]